MFVLPSTDENLPMSVIEAMGNGLAVIATPVGAVPDIIRHGETGLLVPPGDPAALTAALRRLLTDPQLRLRLGRAAQSFHRAISRSVPYLGRLVEIWSHAARRPIREHMPARMPSRRSLLRAAFAAPFWPAAVTTAVPSLRDAAASVGLRFGSDSDVAFADAPA